MSKGIGHNPKKERQTCHEETEQDLKVKGQARDVD
jgi:hypothetical protein